MRFQFYTRIDEIKNTKADSENRSIISIYNTYTLVFILLARQISGIVQQYLLYIRRFVEFYPFGSSLQLSRYYIRLVTTAVHRITEITRIIFDLITIAVTRIGRALAGYREIRLRQTGIGASEQSRIFETCETAR